jgi:hypothetical protein
MVVDGRARSIAAMAAARSTAADGRRAFDRGGSCKMTGDHARL